jgi:hypothetical protein
MFGHKKHHAVPVPSECAGLEVKVESSICTGEKIIGFYDPKTKKLLYSELVTSAKDITDFYAKYGLKS